ncbi:unnamed protein product [Kuraishia capsulata CBS 1993]|uniref:Nucleoporin Nup159/Nup146 N-terminal domain-containing protein n=1 Tax=Kuraishia capsulata CBS 1993 TaxID=1382522 RepID=W6MTZ0_9ASCO|nr:uncharacterized protein KUCA_T00005983001 [Kuraishia capsulata CBS 1993]CDK29988.1 unnamed protein product [Kuraishia capsulata CBS 1993]
MAVEELEELVTEDFGFRKVGSGIRLLSGISDGSTLKHNTLNFLAWDNTTGKYAAYNQTELITGDISKLVEKLGADSTEVEDQNVISTSGKKITSISYTADGSKLIASSGDELLFLSAGETNLQSIRKFDHGVESFQNAPWYGHMTAVLLENGDLHIVNLDQTDTKLIGSSVLSFSWSSFESNSILAGLKNGQLQLVNTENFSERVLNAPVGLAIDPSFPISISSVSAGSWLTFYGDVERDEDERPDYAGVMLTIDGDTLTWKESSLICSPYGIIERKPTIYSVSLHKWLEDFPFLNVVAGALSTDIAIVSPNEIISQLNDGDRAQLPIDEDTGDDDTPLGIALDLTATEDVIAPVVGVERSPPLPRIWVLTQRGELVAWELFYKKGLSTGSVKLDTILGFEAERSQHAKKFTSFEISGKIAESETKPETKAEPISSSKPDSIFKSSPTANPFASSKSPFEVSKSTSDSPFSSVKPLETKTPAFGSSTFGSTATAFGSSTFGQSSTSAFGGSGNSKPAFSFQSGTSGFGKVAQESSPFASLNKTSGETSSPFGGLAAKKTSPPGEKASPFGSLVASKSKETFSEEKSTTPAPAFGGSSIGKSAFGQSSFGNPAAGQNAFGSSAFGKPTFGTTGETESKPSPFGSSAFGKPGFGASSPAPTAPTASNAATPGQTAFGQTSFGSSTFGKSTFGTSSPTLSSTQTAFGSSTFGQSSFGTSLSTAPAASMKSGFGAFASKSVFGNLSAGLNEPVKSASPFETLGSTSKSPFETLGSKSTPLFSTPANTTAQKDTEDSSSEESEQDELEELANDEQDPSVTNNESELSFGNVDLNEPAEGDSLFDETGDDSEVPESLVNLSADTSQPGSEFSRIESEGEEDEAEASTLDEERTLGSSGDEVSFEEDSAAPETSFFRDDSAVVDNSVGDVAAEQNEPVPEDNEQLNPHEPEQLEPTEITKNLFEATPDYGTEESPKVSETKASSDDPEPALASTEAKVPEAAKSSSEGLESGKEQAETAEKESPDVQDTKPEPNKIQEGVQKPQDSFKSKLDNGIGTKYPEATSKPLHPDQSVDKKAEETENVRSGKSSDDWTVGVINSPVEKPMEPLPYLQLRQVVYPTLDEDPDFEEVERLYYDTESEFLVLEKNVSNIGKFIKSHTALDQEYEETSLDRPELWKLDDASTVSQIADSIQSQLKEHLEEKQQVLERVSNVKAQSTTSSQYSLKLSQDLALLNSQFTDKTSIKKKLPLDIRQATIRNAIREKLASAQDSKRELESKILLIKCLVYRDSIQGPKDFEHVLIALDATLRKHISEIKALKELRGSVEKLKVSDRPPVSDLTKSMLRLSMDKLNTGIITKQELRETLGLRKLKPIEISFE